MKYLNYIDEMDLTSLLKACLTLTSHHKKRRYSVYAEDARENLFVNALDLTAPASDALLKNRKNAWVQLAGHPGAFAPASAHTIWKRRLTKENNETTAYQALMTDVVRDIVPKFYREVEFNGDLFIEIEDLLQHFTDPFIMDIKMGTRTFLESEVKNPVLRKDLYEKMIKLSPSEPTGEEHDQKAITKLRYMQFRERGSSTSSQGFRIEAIKMPGESPCTDLKKIRTKEEVKNLFLKFMENDADIRSKLLQRFRHISQAFSNSQFFKHHEIIGSSILIMHDHYKHANAWIIDFAKTLRVEGRTVNHRSAWEIGNHEDGFLFGLDSLTNILEELAIPVTSSSSSPSKEKIANTSQISVDVPTVPAESGHTSRQASESGHTSRQASAKSKQGSNDISQLSRTVSEKSQTKSHDSCVTKRKT